MVTGINNHLTAAPAPILSHPSLLSNNAVWTPRPFFHVPTPPSRENQPPPSAAKKKSSFGMQISTSWLLKQELAGVIDAELTMLLLSISMACKQMASLVHRASISNLTGVQGAGGESWNRLDR